MSGEKRTYVSVDEQDLRRLREQESRLRSVQRDLPDRLNQVRRQAQQEMQNRLRPLEDRQRRHEQVVSGLKSDLVTVERETAARLAAQSREFNSRLDSQRGEYLHLFREQDQKFTGMIESERQARQAAVDRLQRQFDNLAADASRKQHIAGAFVADLSQLTDEVDRMPHDRFAPGRMADLRRHVADAERDLAAGMPEGALSTARRAYWDMADLRAEVMVREEEFTLAHQAAMEEARVILEEARATRRHTLEIGPEGDCDSIDLEVDHWTQGALSAHEAEAGDLLRRLETEEQTLTVEEVRQILAQLEELRARTPEIVDQACAAVLASQYRYEIAEMAAESFQAQGFSIIEGVYEGDDERNSYALKLRNIAGDEVVTVIQPVGDRPGENEVSVHSFEATYVDEKVRMDRAKAMSDSLREQGLIVDAPQCGGDADTSFQNLETVRRRETVATPRRSRS